MARPAQFLEMASGAANALVGLASVPSGADNAIIRCDAGTVRWSETNGSWLTASIGPLLSSVDSAFRIDGGGAPSGGLARFKFVPVGGAGAVQVSYYYYEGRSFNL